MVPVVVDGFVVGVVYVVLSVVGVWVVVLSPVGCCWGRVCPGVCVGAGRCSGRVGARIAAFGLVSGGAGLCDEVCV